MKTSFSTRALPFTKHKLSIMLAQAALLSSPALVWAETDANEPSLEVISVTAERRTTALQETPISVGVISADDLEKSKFNHLFDIERNIAGVTFYKGASNQQSNIIIRGIGTLNMGYPSAVGVYIDDVPLVRAGAAGQWDLPDVERVEVLRGPQGTLYGQNSTAGAVRLISIDPTDDKKAWVSAGIGNYSAFETRGYFAGPLKEGLLAASLAFSHRQHDGFGKNHTTGKKVYSADVSQARAKFRFTPNNDFEAVLAIDSLLDKSDNGTKSPINHPDSTPRDTWSLVDLDGRLQRNGVSLRLTQAINEDTDVRSITAYRGWKHDPSRMEHGGLPRVSNDADQKWRQRVFSQEFQLIGDIDEHLSYTGGVLFIREYFYNDNISKNSADGTVLTNHRRAISEFNTDDIALYGQIDYRFAEDWTLTAGARYWHTKQEYDAEATNLITSQQTLSVSGLEKKSDGVTPRLTLGYRWTPDVFFYGSYTQGAKFGGHNRSAATETVARVAAEPEEVTAYELGIKTAAFSNRLQVNLTLFNNIYEDYLATVSNPILGGVQYHGSVLTNAAKAETYGSELEIRTKLIQGLDWNLSVAYLESEFKEFLNPSGSASGDYTGNKLPYAPRLTAATTLAYSTYFSNGDGLSLFGSLQYVSEQENDYPNLPYPRIASRTNVDVGADYWFAGGHWSASLKVRNLQDKDHVLQKTYMPIYGIDTNAYNEPRTIIASIRYDF